MKKNYFTGMLLFSCISLFSQTATLPYASSFETTQEWTVVNANSDDRTWTFNDNSALAHSGNKYAMYTFSSTIKANDLLLSPEFNLINSKSYNLDFWYSVYDQVYPEKLKVYLCNGPTINDTISLIKDLGSINNENWTKSTNTITVSTSGMYRLGFYACSLADKWSLNLDDVSLNEIYENDAQILSISGAQTSCSLGSSTIVANIKNNGTQVLSSFDMKLIVDGNTIATENVTQTITSQSSFNYTFQATADLNTTGNHTIKAIIIATSDANHLNDTAILNVSKLNPSNLPYFMGFENSDDLSGWNIIDGNNDNNTWTYENPAISAHSGTGSIKYGFSSNNPGRELIISTCLEFNALTNYQVSSWHLAGMASYPEKLKIYLCNGKTINDTIQLIKNFGSITDDAWTNSISTFTVPSTGSYYLGFYANSDADKFSLLLDDIEISEATTGIETTNIDNIKIYPNPAQSEINITSNKNIETIEIIDYLGQTVNTFTPNKLSIKIPIESMAKGIYIVKVNGILAEKVIVK